LSVALAGADPSLLPDTLDHALFPSTFLDGRVPPRHFLHRGLVLVPDAAATSGAGELKVDINRDSKNSDSVTETGFTMGGTGTSYGTTTPGETVVVGFSQPPPPRPAAGKSN